MFVSFCAQQTISTTLISSQNNTGLSCYVGFGRVVVDVFHQISYKRHQSTALETCAICTNPKPSQSHVTTTVCIARSRRRASSVVSVVELGQEVGRTRRDGVLEEAHHVRLLLPVQRLHELHLTLKPRRQRQDCEAQRHGVIARE